MKCPRCGGEMLGGVCKECGFPITTKIGWHKRKRLESRLNLFL